MLRQAMDVLLDFIHRHARKQNHRQATPVLLQVPQNMESIHARHLQIQQHDVDLAVFKVLQCGRTIADFIYEISRPPEEMGERHPLHD